MKPRPMPRPAGSRPGSSSSTSVFPRSETPASSLPSGLSESTEEFTDAPVQIVEYADLLCPDCKRLADQIHQLAEEFPGKLNVAFQPFPLEALCNDVVEKDLHPGACDVHFLAAHDPDKFKAIYDEIWGTWPPPRGPERVEWIQELGEQFGVSDGLTDPETQALVQELIQTGKEYEKTCRRVLLRDPLHPHHDPQRAHGHRNPPLRPASSHRGGAHRPGRGREPVPRSLGGLSRSVRSNTCSRPTPPCPLGGQLRSRDDRKALRSQGFSFGTESV